MTDVQILLENWYLLVVPGGIVVFAVLGLCYMMWQELKG